MGLKEVIIMSFRNDYSVLVHPRILEAIIKYQNEVNIPYGLDYHSENAKKYIRKMFNAPKADIHFVGGGTQANLLVISCLRNYEAVISADTGHINVHETGAIEGTGHKIITVNNKDGKLSSLDILNVLKVHKDEHMVKPRMVYISNTTETGSFYALEELESISQVCKENDLYLFLDGARLSSALAASNIKPNDYTRLCDVFYIGGTKNGLMIGEALIINNNDISKDFRHHIKNKGAMLAKGYLLGIEFEELFKDNLYLEIGEKANAIASYLKQELLAINIDVMGGDTNQLFVKLDKKLADFIIKKYETEVWEELDNETVIRFVTSFTSTTNDVDSLIKDIKERL